MRCPPALRALGALVVLLLLLGGLPSLLAVAVGTPLAGLPDLAAGDVTDAALIDVLAAVAWLAWAQFAVATAVEGVSALRRTPMPRRIPLLLPGQQQFARVLVTALLLTPAVASTLLPTTPYARAASTSPGTHAPRPGVTSTATGASPGGHRPPATFAPGHGKQPAARHAELRQAITPLADDRTDLTGATGTTVYVVPAGDGAGTYWDLAATWAGERGALARDLAAQRRPPASRRRRDDFTQVAPSRLDSSAPRTSPPQRGTQRSGNRPYSHR